MFDSRAFGQGPLSSVGVGEVNALELVQAYAKIRLGARRERTLKLGRFTMDLGSKRFVSRQNFRNTTNAYTGARFDTPLADGALTAFWVMPQVRLPDDRAAIEDNRIAWDRESSNLQFAGLFWTRDLGHGPEERLDHLCRLPVFPDVQPQEPGQGGGWRAMDRKPRTGLAPRSADFRDECRRRPSRPGQWLRLRPSRGRLRDRLHHRRPANREPEDPE